MLGMCLLVQADLQNARLAMMLLYAELKISEDEGDLVRRASAGGLKQDTHRCGANPPSPLLQKG
jgi:hypothetical protein